MHWQMCTVSFLLYRLLPTCLLFVIQLSFGTMSVLTSFTWHMNSPLFYISSNKYCDAATNGSINIVFLKDSPVGGRARLGGRLWQVRGTSWSAATNATLVNLHMIESFDEVVNVPVSWSSSDPSCPTVILWLSYSKTYSKWSTRNSLPRRWCSWRWPG